MEELIGEEHQQRGDSFKQDAVSDVAGMDTEHTQLKWLNVLFWHSLAIRTQNNKKHQDGDKAS